MKMSLHRNPVQPVTVELKGRHYSAVYYFTLSLLSLYSSLKWLATELTVHICLPLFGQQYHQYLLAVTDTAKRAAKSLVDLEAEPKLMWTTLSAWGAVRKWSSSGTIRLSIHGATLLLATVAGNNVVRSSVYS